MIAGSIVMIILGLLIMLGTSKLSKPTDYSTWKEADGVVTGVRTQDWDDGEMRPCLPHLYVVFEINGKSVKGRSNYIGTEKTIKQVIAKYPKGTQVHFRYKDANETGLEKLADKLNFNKYIQIDDKEFPSDSVDKKAELFAYAFGLVFVLIGIIGIVKYLLTI